MGGGDQLDSSTSGGAGPNDQCEGWGDNKWPNECGSGPGWGGAQQNFGLGGYHASGWGFNGKGGFDLFWVTSPLQNGWVLQSTSATWLVKVGDVSTASEDQNATAAPGSLSPWLGVDWYVGNCGALEYAGHMIITGPLGVPF
jgi:hypothetical protein